MNNALKRKLGYERHIITQLHEEIFQTTSEHKYYELGVAVGMNQIYKMLNLLIQNGYDTVVNNKNDAVIELADIINNIILSPNDSDNISTLLNKMIEYDKKE